MKTTSLILLCVAILFAEKANTASWSYNDIPGWSTSFPLCSNGKKQSPIDISTDISNSSSSSSSSENEFSDPTIIKDDSVSSVNTLLNNGHSIKLSFEKGRYTISGMNLPSNYNVAQFHFHWGSTNNEGSEHTLNGKSFPIEMHIVTYKESFATLTDAVTSGNSDALAVFGFFFTVAETDNLALQPVTSNIPMASGLTASLNDFDLEGLISGAFEEPYHRYSGSLTTPSCNEVVIWTVFEKTIDISQSQLQAFRNTGIVDNYRPVQPLNGRSVIHVE